MNPQNDYANDFGITSGLNNRESPDWNQNQIKLQPNIPNQVVVEQPPQHDANNKKKNRTLQFYKFLFYSMKIEIKINEFVDLVRFANQSEISLWILSLVLYAHSPKGYSNTFIWIHLIHFIRGLIGFLIMIKLPRSYEIVEAMKNVSEKDLETKLFNDIARSVVKKQVVDKFQGMKGSLIFYFILTFINFIFDIVDFLYTLSHLSKDGMKNNEKVILLSLFLICLLYLAIDLAYIFWINSLKYHFPAIYLDPISQVLSGAVEKVRKVFKLGKKETDIKQEAAMQNKNESPIFKEQPPSNDIIVSRPVYPENIHINFNSDKMGSNNVDRQYKFTSNNEEHLDK